jgi:hypothetical protein
MRQLVVEAQAAAAAAEARAAAANPPSPPPPAKYVGSLEADIARTGMVRTHRAEIERMTREHKAALRALRDELATARREAADEAALASELKQRSATSDVDAKSLAVINAQMEAEVSGLRSATEALLYNTKLMGAELLSVVLLRPAIQVRGNAPYKPHRGEGAQRRTPP